VRKRCRNFIAMKIEPIPLIFSNPPSEQSRVSSPAGRAFSISLQNIASGTLAVNTLSTPVGLSLTQSSEKILQTKSKQSLNERALGLRAYKQELLASNIANADTPGYRAVDINVNDALRTGKTKDNVEVQFRIPSQSSADGNTVDMDVERAQFAKNGLMYEYTVDRVRGYYKMMDDLIRNTPY